MVETNDEWNLYCCLTKTEKLSDAYYHYYIFFFGIVFWIIAFIISILKLVAQRKCPIYDPLFASFAKKMILYIAMSALICAWFSLGDGALPNDRYVTLCHVVWNLWIYGAFMRSREKEAIVS